MSIKNKTILGPLVASILAALFFSIHWVIPTYQSSEGTQFEYLPVRYHSKTLSDNYFYYSRIREFIDGNLFSGDHATFENKNGITPHLTYSVSFFASSLGALFTGKTEHAYYFTYLFFPFIGCFLLCTLLTRMGVSSLLSVSIALFVYVNVPALTRTPNNLVTNVFLLSFYHLFYSKVRSPSFHWGRDILLVLSLGTSSLVSVPNMFISYALYSFSICFFFIRELKDSKVLQMLILALIISTPGFYVLLAHYFSDNSDWINLAIPPIEKYQGFHWPSISPVIKLLIYTVILWIPMLFCEFRRRKLLIVTFGGMLSVYLFVLLFQGAFTARYIYHRGGEVLYFAIVVTSFLLFVKDVMETRVLKLRLLGLKRDFEVRLGSLKIVQTAKYAFVGVICLFSLTSYFMKLSAEIKSTVASAEYYNLPHLKELSDWMRENLDKDDVMLSLDFDLNTNIGVYVPQSTYLAFAQQSPVTSDERFRRLIEMLKFHGVSPGGLHEILMSMDGHGKEEFSTEQEHQLGYFQLLMFYGKSSLNDAEVVDIDQKYESYFLQDSFTYKADVVVFSNYSMSLVAPGSAAALLISDNLPIYKNKKYSVYRL